jgi:glutaredoxin
MRAEPSLTGPATCIHVRSLLLFLAALFGACAAIAQTTTTLYKSTGPDGRTIYSDKPVPNASDTRTITFRNLPASPLSAQTLAYIEEMKKSADARIAAPPPSDTVLFSAKWCVYCKQAKAHLAGRQVAYRELDIETREGALAYARAGGKSVPLLLFNGQSVAGYSAAGYDALLARGR